MSFLKWLLGGINFDKIEYGKVGDIIYPAYNGTNGMFKNSRWDLVLEVNKKGKIKRTRYIWDVATVEALNCRKLLKVLKQ